MSRDVPDPTASFAWASSSWLWAVFTSVSASAARACAWSTLRYCCVTAARSCSPDPEMSASTASRFATAAFGLTKLALLTR